MASTNYCFTIMFISLVLVVNSYRCICLKDGSWISWYTFPAFMARQIIYRF